MNNVSNKLLFAPYFKTPEDTPFITKIGGTTYEVTSHFNAKSKETVLQQFMDLILEQKSL